MIGDRQAGRLLRRDDLKRQLALLRENGGRRVCDERMDIARLADFISRDRLEFAGIGKIKHLLCPQDHLPLELAFKLAHIGDAHRERKGIGREEQFIGVVIFQKAQRVKSDKRL